MFVRTCSKKTVIPLALVTLLFAAGCAPQSQSDDNVASETVVTKPSHPDRQPTKADVDAGTACFQPPISTIVWKEKDRKYIGENGWCKYEEK